MYMYNGIELFLPKLLQGYIYVFGNNSR